MKSKILCFLLIAISSLKAEEVPEKKSEVEQSYGYFSAGLGPFPIPLPTFAGGYRAQSGHHGFDASLQVQTYIIATNLQANLLYLHYFKPNLDSQFYVGGGLGSGVTLGHHFCNYSKIPSISPEFVFGKEYRNESQDLRFFQLQVEFPVVYLVHRGDVSWFPRTTISYGIGF